MSVASMTILRGPRTLRPAVDVDSDHLRRFQSAAGSFSASADVWHMAVGCEIPDYCGLLENPGYRVRSPSAGTNTSLAVTGGGEAGFW